MKRLKRWGEVIAYTLTPVALLVLVMVVFEVLWLVAEFIGVSNQFSAGVAIIGMLFMGIWFFLFVLAPIIVIIAVAKYISDKRKG